jgi:hypothetical protein
MKIYKKLAAFQNECPVIHKGTQGFNYTYADLPSILEIVNPILKKHNLGFTQPLDGENLKTILFDIETGETIESTVHIQQNVQLAKMNDFQVLGSAITYYRRYSLSALLGIVTDKDTDAAGKPEKKSIKLPELLPTDETNWLKVKQALNNGFTIDQVKTKWSLSKENQEILIREAV